MHNMMVEVRLERDEEEKESMYAIETGEEESMQEISAKVEPGSERENRLNTFVLGSIGLKPTSESSALQGDVLTQRWQSLYDDQSHIKLQTAVMNHIAGSYLARKKKRKKKKRKKKKKKQVAGWFVVIIVTVLWKSLKFRWKWNSAVCSRVLTRNESFNFENEIVQFVVEF